MNFPFISAILIIGSSGLIAQALILRELLISFYGNELTLGLVLANWLIAEALGVFTIGRLIDRVKNKINIFVILEIAFSLSLPFSIYYCRIFKSFLGIPFGESIGLLTIFTSSFFITLPVSFCHGALFSVSSKIYSLYTKENSEGSIGKVYTWESIGTIMGGLVFTYFLIPFLNSFQVAFLMSLVNFCITIAFFKLMGNKLLKYLTLLVTGTFVFFTIFGGVRYINELSIKKQWKNLSVLEYRNSVYGNVTLTEQKSQYTLFYNGSPIITAPYPDITFVEEFANFPLLFHSAPKNILIIGSGAGGLMHEVLKYPIKSLDYAELDPLIINTLKKYPISLTQSELNDPRVNIINLDGRYFLRDTKNSYDIILLGLSKPSDLSTNRLFTEEFFALAKKRINKDGILALWLPGSLTYLSQELKDLNSCILNSLKSIYSFVRIIPGDYNIYLSSDSKDIIELGSSQIAERIRQRSISTNILIPDYLNYRLDKQWLNWFIKNSKDAKAEKNRDLRPFAVFEMLIFWNKQYSPFLAQALSALGNLKLSLILIFILMLTVTISLVFYRKQLFSKAAVAFSIFTTGFFGMLVSLILVFSYQVFYGYLYYKIGLLVSIFMAGIAFGSLCITRKLKGIKDSYRLLIIFESAILIFTFFLGLIFSKFSGLLYNAENVFLALFFISGILMGLEFPLAAKICLSRKEEAGKVSGLLYAADLFGGWFAGIFTGIIFLPVLGLFNTCLIIVILKISSIFLILSSSQRFKNL